jgi:hypothetical protein
MGIVFPNEGDAITRSKDFPFLQSYESPYAAAGDGMESFVYCKSCKRVQIEHRGHSTKKNTNGCCAWNKEAKSSKGRSLVITAPPIPTTPTIVFPAAPPPTTTGVPTSARAASLVLPSAVTQSTTLSSSYSPTSSLPRHTSTSIVPEMALPLSLPSPSLSLSRSRNMQQSDEGKKRKRSQSRDRPELPMMPSAPATLQQCYSPSPTTRCDPRFLSSLCFCAFHFLLPNSLTEVSCVH